MLHPRGAAAFEHLRGAGDRDRRGLRVTDGSGDRPSAWPAPSGGLPGSAARIAYRLPVVPATTDEMLRSIRAGEPSATFLDMVVQKVRVALTPVPPPSGMRWRDEDVEQVAGDLIGEKWPKFVAAAWDLETDLQLRAWATKVARNYVRDLGRATLRGRLTRRVQRIIADLNDVRLEGGVVLASGTAGSTPANDRDGLLAPLWDIATTTSWWNAPGDEDRTPGDREDLVLLIRHIVAAADGPVDLDLLVDVLAYRLNLPLGWSVGRLDYELASQYVQTVDDVAPTSRTAAARLLSGLTENERRALPSYAENPDVSTAEIGRVLGKSKSTGATVKASLEQKIRTFAKNDPDAKAALRTLVRDVLAGRFDVSGRSDSGEKEEDPDAR